MILHSDPEFRISRENFAPLVVKGSSFGKVTNSFSKFILSPGQGLKINTVASKTVLLSDPVCRKSCLHVVISSHIPLQIILDYSPTHVKDYYGKNNKKWYVKAMPNIRHIYHAVNGFFTICLNGFTKISFVLYL